MFQKNTKSYYSLHIAFTYCSDYPDELKLQLAISKDFQGKRRKLNDTIITKPDEYEKVLNCTKTK